MTVEMLARQLDPTGALGQAIAEDAAETRRGLASGKRGPAFDETPYQIHLKSAHALFRSAYEERTIAELGRALTPEELKFCDEQAGIAMRRFDLGCYESDRDDAVGLTVEHFKGRPSMALDSYAVAEVSREAIAVYRSVEARS